jgi:alpha-beta hydrolase superfamily lysophospholipase
MKQLWITGILALGLALGAAQEIKMKAADGVAVYGVYNKASGMSRGLMLLFHSAGESHEEYDSSAPRFNKIGFDTLAIDQRSGGSKSHTAQEYNQIASYNDVLPDLEAALEWARTNAPDKRVIVVGSSYSSALVFLLAAKHQSDIAGVMSFSPDEYLRPMGVVKESARQVNVPVFISSARKEAGNAREILEAVGSRDKVQFVPKGEGVHGAFALVNMSDEYWVAVKRFVGKFQ